ncbi:MAG: PAS domain S-box protein [Bacteroidia bacterium]|jgi:PAS domain S-box-containing protein|nr:PAS domain S-box protein [Bacteroidia bacterium]
MTGFLKLIFTRNTFAERILFLALAGGIAVDGIINNSFSQFGTEAIIRCFIFIAALLLFSISFYPRISRQMLRAFAFIAIAMLFGFSVWLCINRSFDADNTLTLLGIIVICSMYFRTLRGLFIYLGITLAVTLAGVLLVDEPKIDTTIFFVRLLLGDILILGLSQATRSYFLSLRRQNERISAENRQLIDRQTQLAEQLTHEQLLSLVANRANAVVMITSSTDKIEWVNSVFTDITGYTAEEVLGRDPSFLRGPDTDLVTVRRIEQRKLNPEPFVEEILNYRRNGTPVWMELNVAPLLDDDGRVTRWIAIQEDITNRKLKDEELRMSQEQLNAAQQQAKIGSWVWFDADNRIQCSDELCNMFALRTNDLISPVHFYEFIHPDDRAIVKRVIDNSRSRKSPFEVDTRMVVRNEEYKVYLTGQYDASKRRMIGTVQNITDRKILEESMRLAEVQYRQLFEHLQHMIATHDMNGVLLSVNPSGAHAGGYEPEEIIGRNLSEFLSPSSRVNFPHYLAELREKGSSSGLLNLERRDGGISIWLYNNVRLKDANGVDFVLCSNVDITDRYRMENELRIAKKTAEEALVAKDRFVANISHELRTPMNAIIGFADVLANSPLNNEQREYIGALKIASETLTAVISDILDLARIEAGKIEFSEVPFSVSNTLKDTYRLLRQRAQEAGLDFNWHCAENVPAYVLGDDLRLRQILINLAGNAIKFTPAGRVNMQCTVHEESDESIVLRFEVADTGIGIPADKLASIFEPFTQASSESTRRYGGTGLGLTIVKDLVELQGGSVKVRSVEHEGTVFTVWLPVKRVSTLAVKEMNQALVQLTSPGQYTILLVEDHPLNQQLALKLITDFGFKTALASNGQEAIDELQRPGAAFDLVLMDLNMPVLDGHEATRRIRQELKLTLPIIALTAHSSQTERERCLEVGMNDYLSKPFRARELYYRIARQLGAQTTEAEITATPPEPEQSGTPLQMLAAGNKAFEIEMLTLMQQSVSGDVASIADAIARNDMQAIKSNAHRLKSTVSLAGDKDFALLLTQIEKNPQHTDAGLAEKLGTHEQKFLKLLAARLTELQ